MKKKVEIDMYDSDIGFVGTLVAKRQQVEISYGYEKFAKAIENAFLP